VRIIAGEFRGRKLLPPEGDVTRPVTDRVKQSLFDILAPVLPGARVYDCFAGTGSMGLESLSRGARHAVFFEQHRPAVQRLRRNIETLGVGDRSTVVVQDLFKWFAAAPPPAADERAGCVFLDPPYRFLNDQPDALRRLAASIAADHLAPEGVLVFRHDASDQLELPDLVRFDQRDYGGMSLEFLRRVSARGSEPRESSESRESRESRG
jgi:16S rRNA (guanine966-N2)-methyltransferase